MQSLITWVRQRATLISAAVPTVTAVVTGVDRWVHGGVMPPAVTFVAAVGAVLAIFAHRNSQPTPIPSSPPRPF